MHPELLNDNSTMDIASEIGQEVVDLKQELKRKLVLLHNPCHDRRSDN